MRQHQRKGSDLHLPDIDPLPNPPPFRGGEREPHPRAFTSSGTAASYFELCSTSDVRTFRTCGAAVRCVTKSWNVAMSGATHFRTKSTSPDSIQHSRTNGSARTKSSNARKIGVGLARQMDGRKYRDVETELSRIEQPAIALDVAGLLQRPDAAQARRRRNADAFGQLNIRDSAVSLDFAQDFEVNFVKILRHAVRVPQGEGASGGWPPIFAAACGNTLSPARPHRAILLRVRCVNFLAHGKFCSI